MKIFKFQSIIACLFCSCLMACVEKESSTAEAQINVMLSSAENAAEAKDVDALVSNLSSKYRDGYGQGKETAKVMLNYYFSRNQHINLYSRILPLELIAPDSAKITVYVAMSGRSITGPEELGRLSADLFRFDFTILEENPGTWKVVRANWRKAALSDFS